ncbi:MAG: YerC/YecD family TrpR-related protein [Patescibacteria group bacterium]
MIHNQEKQLDLLFDLINAFSLVKTSQESALLLQDLLTAGEIRNLGQRLRIAKLLLAGETQRDISTELKCSIATVIKVKSWLDQKGDGFRNVISKLPERYMYPEKLAKKPIEFQLPEALLKVAQYGLARSQEKRLQNFSETIKSK